MKLRIDRGHATARMQQRGISRRDIESAIASAHTVLAVGGSMTYIGPGLNGTDLKVWVLPPGYVDEDTTIIVKSAAWKGR